MIKTSAGEFNDFLDSDWSQIHPDMNDDCHLHESIITVDGQREDDYHKQYSDDAVIRFTGSIYDPNNRIQWNLEWAFKKWQKGERSAVVMLQVDLGVYTKKEWKEYFSKMFTEREIKAKVL